MFECNLTTVCFNNGSERREAGTGQMFTKRDAISMIHPRKKSIGKPVEFFFYHDSLMNCNFFFKKILTCAGCFLST